MLHEGSYPREFVACVEIEGSALSQGANILQSDCWISGGRFDVMISRFCFGLLSGYYVAICQLALLCSFVTCKMYISYR